MRSYVFESSHKNMKLYAYSIPDVEKLAGFLKIGETTRAVKSRVKQQGHEIPIKKNIVWERTLVANRTNVDKMIIRFLEKQGCEVIRFEETGEQSEWVKCEKEDIELAFEKIKEQIRSEDKRKELEQKFYEELRNWYFWVTEETKNPDCSLRVIIRLLLCFFLRERGLVPACLFERSFIEENLKEDEYRYFKVIIRNLFFYSLNTPQDKRKELENKNLIKNYGIVKKQFHENIPFLNGGLFTEHSGDEIPLNDDYFFTAPRTRTLKELDGKFPVAGIVYILSQYKYTLDETENSELIDPEFIGKMFECLLSCIDADTKENRRKVTGSYYTPREIVDYMVNEALDAYLARHSRNSGNLDDKLHSLGSRFHGNDENDARHSRDGGNLDDVLHSLGSRFHGNDGNCGSDYFLQCKILDPACGSGAFPCGVMNIILQRMSEGKTLTSAERYQAKLKILQNVIYGIDIQPMAVQIAMLRLFLSLIQEIQPDKS
ncbi:MAG: GIY-YIG nuclease family protein, partial [Planctomycetaceae bacterium]|nr:GIY-YIG nuclease family protein [Planctomycetaceae bacterium]